MAHAMPNTQVATRVTRLIKHLRDRHGLQILGCDRCEGAGCPGCHFQGILGVDFDAGKDDACGPDCPANDLFRQRLN
jgi:hypothetical protein